MPSRKPSYSSASWPLSTYRASWRKFWAARHLSSGAKEWSFMQPRADSRSPATALLTIEGGGGVWALPSLSVVSVEPFSEGGSDVPFDVLALLGAAPVAADQVARVLVLSVEGERLRLLA